MGVDELEAGDIPGEVEGEARRGGVEGSKDDREDDLGIRYGRPGRGAGGVEEVAEEGRAGPGGGVLGRQRAATRRHRWQTRAARSRSAGESRRKMARMASSPRTPKAVGGGLLVVGGPDRKSVV